LRHRLHQHLQGAQDSLDAFPDSLLGAFLSIRGLRRDGRRGKRHRHHHDRDQFE